MSYLLIALGAVGAAGGITYVLVREGRRLMSRRAGALRTFASRRDWQYMVRDDGRAREALENFRGIDTFESASGRPSIPHNVIEGRLDGRRVLVFEHVLPAQDLDLPFHVVTVETAVPVPGTLVIHRKHDGETRPLVDDNLEGPVGLDGTDAFELYHEGLSGRDEPVGPPWRREVIKRLESLPWPTDLQVRDGGLAVYTCNENTLGDAEDINRMLEVARRAARRLEGSRDGVRSDSD